MITIHINSHSSSIIGYALCYFKIFTDLRRSLFLDSLFVRNETHNDDKSNTDVVKRQLAENVMQFGIANRCSRLELHVLQTDSMWSFWKEAGALDLTADRGINCLRINRAGLQRLTASM